jgi:predicted TIM-barrel fold metal-dependent hydrolase
VTPRVDSHAHIIDPARFPYDDGPGYKPLAHETGDAASYAATLAGAGVSHALLVQPSCYGFDNRAMLDAIAGGDGRFRGIAVVSPDATEDELVLLRAGGVDGVRLNLQSYDPDFFTRPQAHDFLARIRAEGMFVQVNALGAAWPAILPALLEAGAHVIVDHLGQPDLDAGVAQPGFDAVLRLAREGDAIVKLSGGPRMSRLGLPYADLRPFVDRAVEVFGIERCLWGSDWPFLGVATRPRYAEVLQALEMWLPNDADRARVLWDNPARLFGFAARSGA